MIRRSVGLEFFSRVLFGALCMFAISIAGMLVFGFPTTEWIGRHLGLSSRSEAILFFGFAAGTEEVAKVVGATLAGLKGFPGKWFYSSSAVALVFAATEFVSNGFIAQAFRDEFAWQDGFAVFRVLLLHVSLTLLALMVARLFHGRWYGFVLGVGVATVVHALNNLTAFGAFGPMEPYVAFTTAGAFAAIIAALFHLRFRLSWT